MVILPIVIVLALSGTIQVLAGATATLILVMFALVNLSLLAIKRRHGASPRFKVPIVVPAIALVLNLALVAFASNDSRLLAIGFVAVGVFLIVIRNALSKGRLSSP
jgi:amino acid transporter